MNISLLDFMNLFKQVEIKKCEDGIRIECALDTSTPFSLKVSLNNYDIDGLYAVDGGMENVFRLITNMLYSDLVTSDKFLADGGNPNELYKYINMLEMNGVSSIERKLWITSTHSSWPGAARRGRIWRCIWWQDWSVWMRPCTSPSCS